MMGQNQGMYGGGGPGMYGGGPGGMQQQQMQMSPSIDVLQISVPNWAVGAIIGAKGFNIKQIIRDSNASVTVESKPKEEEENPSAERIVTIKGTPEAQWRASYFIFEKLRAEGFSGNDDVRLRTAIKVPAAMVGRVIGRRGKNVRDIQRMTGAMVQLAKADNTHGEEAIVEITGNHLATQNAQSRIRAVINMSHQQMGGPMLGPPQRRGPPPPQPPTAAAAGAAAAPPPRVAEN